MREPPIPPAVMAEGFVTAALLETVEALAHALRAQGGDPSRLLDLIEARFDEAHYRAGQQARSYQLDRAAEASTITRRRIREIFSDLREKLGALPVN
ncbi:hypothetical protein IMF23_05245 [Chelatococcus daeguensis]|nr:MULTISPECIES: hypothetical protein [Chelatococcus]MBM3082843.1 hypothetical protein [Chelatococcus daeguensis]CUA89660.1 hypothetical protein Ga0061061_10982 [Chelatococcus sambhunathii]